MTEVERLKERLIELFDMDEPFTVSLNGQWGVGKTHFWNNFVDTYLSKRLKEKEKEKYSTSGIKEKWNSLKTKIDNYFGERKLLQRLEDKFEVKLVAYVSLFGKDSLSDIESDILLQVSKVTKIKNLLNKGIGNVGLSGVKVSSALSLIPKSRFKNIVICFDDFERKSKKLDSKDILGLISKFKEQKNCKIVIIYNEEEMKKLEDQKTLSEYKDKVIDYELHYKPTVNESYKAISFRLKCFKKYPVKYFSEYGINNIRVMKRVINALNDYKFIEKELEYFPELEEEVANSIITIAVINAKLSSFDLKKVVEYSRSKIYKKNNLEVNEEYEKVLYYLGTKKSYFFETNILENVKNYIDNSIIEKEHLLNVIKNKKVNKAASSIRSGLNEVDEKRRFNLDYSDKDYSEKVLSLLKSGSELIIDILNEGLFLFYINKLIEIDKEKEKVYRAFAVEKFKEHLEKKIKSDSTRGLTTFGTMNDIKKFDTSLQEFIEEKEKEFKLEKVKSADEIIGLFKSPRENHGWSKEPEYLLNVKKETYKDYIEKSPDFLREVVSFIAWIQTFSNGSSFDGSVKIMIDALNDLMLEDKYKLKIEEILKSLNLFELENL